MAKLLLDENSRSNRKRGRPKTIPDRTLEGWRDSLVWPLEHYWGQTGYQLQQATTTAHVRDAFSSLPDPQCNQFQLFRRPYSRAAKTLEQRHSRRLYGELSEQARLARETEEKCRNSLNVALSALRAAQGTTQQQAMEHEQQVRARALMEAVQRRIHLEERQRTLSERVAGEESGFAQTELLRFILDRRYELTPINFANAMAGLPYMAWRQSFKRCMRWDCSIANSVEYREFKIISVFLRSDVRAESLAERMRLYMQRKKLDKETKAPVAQLKQNWHYLGKAIERIEKEDLPSDAVPFRIMAEYQQFYQSHTPVDAILAEEERLW